MLALVPWLVFLHVLSALLFFLAHGTSVAVAFQIRRETDLERIRAMLDLSGSTVMVMSIMFLLMGITGLIMPFLLEIWNKGWIWTSIILMVIVVLQMGFRSSRHYHELRRLMGMAYLVSGKPHPAEPPVGREEAISYISDKLKVGELVGVGIIIPIIVLWLMVFKPF